MKYRFGKLMTDVLRTAPACMIAVAMSDNCFSNRLPGIDVEITSRTIKPVVGEVDEHHTKLVKRETANGKRER